MVADGRSNSYEEMRKMRVQANLKHLEDLGIAMLSKGLVEAAQKEKKLHLSHTHPKEKKRIEGELRRSSRARNTAITYIEEFADPEPHRHRIRRSANQNSSAGREYTGRIASYEQIAAAVKIAEIFQSGLNHPSFIKTMVLSNVSSGFWLGLPSKFCKEHIPQSVVKVMLEDENDNKCEAVYIEKKTGLSGGWRGFALEHKLEAGDALLFELIKPSKFKIYTFKAIEEPISEVEPRSGETGEQAQRSSKQKRKC